MFTLLPTHRQPFDQAVRCVDARTDSGQAVLDQYAICLSFLVQMLSFASKSISGLSTKAELKKNTNVQFGVLTLGHGVNSTNSQSRMKYEHTKFDNPPALPRAHFGKCQKVKVTDAAALFLNICTPRTNLLQVSSDQRPCLIYLRSFNSRTFWSFCVQLHAPLSNDED